MRVSPCKGCNDRTAECHAFCTAYKDWKKIRNEIVEKRGLDSMSLPDLPRRMMRKIWKDMRWK